MTTWRWVFVGVGLAAFAVTAVLIATRSASASQVANGFWAVVAVGALVQLVLSTRRSSKPSRAAPPGVQRPGEVEDTAGPTAPADRS
jgi:peptidoglycan/LPS O-acetylase OafA/YrhL